MFGFGTKKRKNKLRPPVVKKYKGRNEKYYLSSGKKKIVIPNNMFSVVVNNTTTKARRAKTTNLTLPKAQVSTKDDIASLIKLLIAKQFSSNPLNPSNAPVNPPINITVSPTIRPNINPNIIPNISPTITVNPNNSPNINPNITVSPLFDQLQRQVDMIPRVQAIPRGEQGEQQIRPRVEQGEQQIRPEILHEGLLISPEQEQQFIPDILPEDERRIIQDQEKILDTYAEREGDKPLPEIKEQPPKPPAPPKSISPPPPPLPPAPSQIKKPRRSREQIADDNAKEYLVKRFGDSANQPGFRPSTEQLIDMMEYNLYGAIKRLYPEHEYLALYPDQPKNLIPLKGFGDEKKEGLFDSQINSMMLDNPKYLGTITRDEITNLIPKANVVGDLFGQFGFIMNLDTRKTDNFQHWVAVYCNLDESKEICYYDPFGKPPPFEKIYKDLTTLVDSFKLPYYLKLKVNNIKNQSYKSDTCGYHCMIFLDKMFNGWSFKDATNHGVIKGEGDISNLKKFGYV